MDDRIKWLNGHTDEYLRILNEMNQQEEVDEIQGELTRAELEAKLKEAQERLARYEGYQKLMEETGASQLSITDADEKLMKKISIPQGGCQKESCIRFSQIVSVRETKKI